MNELRAFKAAPLLAKENVLLNRLEDALATMPPAECPVKHTFTPGLYIREVFMPAGTILTSKIHKTEHPFVIMKGRVGVWTQESGLVELTAPFFGITRAGTRRALVIHEDCSWITFHPTKLTDLKEIEAELIEPHDIPEQKNLQNDPAT